MRLSTFPCIPFPPLLLIACYSLIQHAESFLIPTAPPLTSHLHQIRVLYESDRILAIEKPHNISHHDDDERPGILSVLRQEQSSRLVNYQGRLYGVHRLDRVTSGILVLAKDSETAGLLSSKFRQGNVTKYYCGISAKKPSNKKQGWVKGSLVKSRRKSWMLTRETDADNYAVTRFFTAGLTKLSSQVIRPNVVPKTLLLFRPLTGKTHQLRVAAKSVGLPLLGDDIYSDGGEASGEAVRTYLHSCALHVQLDDDEQVTIWSQPPFAGSLWQDSEEFNQILARLVDKHCDCPAVTDVINSMTSVV